MMKMTNCDYAGTLVRRSRLIMPVNVPKFVEKAYLRNADAIVLDLEDSVPKPEKLAARTLLKDLIPLAGKGGSDVLVRVNNTEELLIGDIDASVRAGLAGLVIPKVESAAQVGAIEKIIEELEEKRGVPKGQVKLSVLIESAKGYLHMDEIAQASERIDSLTLGMEDFLWDAGIAATDETYHALLFPRMQLVLTARAYRKIPMGLMGSLAAYGDAEAFEKSAVLAYKHGFLGASCIHPGNVETLNKAFSPCAAEIESSEKIAAAFEAALAVGRASVSLDGKMIDYVHYEKARQLIARKKQIEAFELKKKEARQKTEAASGKEAE